MIKLLFMFQLPLSILSSHKDPSFHPPPSPNSYVIQLQNPYAYFNKASYHHFRILFQFAANIKSSAYKKLCNLHSLPSFENLTLILLAPTSTFFHYHIQVRLNIKHFSHHYKFLKSHSHPFAIT